MPEATESRSEVKTMIYVIGISYSAEYAIKGLYENTVGRVFEWIRGDQRTPQDDYARAVLQDYAAFLYTVPWFKYPFREKLDGLMAITTPTRSIARTWERGFALGTEYFVKIGYASLIQKALDAAGDNEPRDIMFVVATLPPDVLAKEPRIKPIRTLTHGMAADTDAALQGFYRNSARLARQGHRRCRDRGKSRNLHHRDRAQDGKAGRKRHSRTVFARSRCKTRVPPRWFEG